MKNKETQLSEEMEKRVDESFYHEESIETHLPCEFLLNNENGKCNCQLGDFKQFLATALEEQRLEYIEQIKALKNDYPNPSVTAKMLNLQVDEIVELLNKKL